MKRNENKEAVPALASCGTCGGWTAFGGMSHHVTEKFVMGRRGCDCNRAKWVEPKDARRSDVVIKSVRRYAPNEPYWNTHIAVAGRAFHSTLLVYGGRPSRKAIVDKFFNEPKIWDVSVVSA